MGIAGGRARDLATAQLMANQPLMERPSEALRASEDLEPGTHWSDRAALLVFLAALIALALLAMWLFVP